LADVFTQQSISVAIVMEKHRQINRKWWVHFREDISPAKTGDAL